MVWYDDPTMVILVVVSSIGLGYLTYRLLKMI